MLCRFSTISEWISLCVVILLGLAILSKGEEHTFLHDKLSKERTPCHLRCAKDSNEGISLEECVERCQRKLMLSSESNIKHKKRIITKTLIRHQREVGNTNEINECGFSSQASAPHRVEKEKITINFTAPEGPIYVTWEAPDFSKIDFNWTNYALIYHGEGVVDAHCKVLPKNQTDYLVTQLDNWKYPETFHLAVVTYPYRWDKIVLHDFTPAGHNKDHTIYIPTVSKKDTAKFVSSIVGGLIAGVALLVILYSAVKWKRSRLCPVVDDRRMPPPVPARPENAKSNKERYYCCYYPENEVFRERVASIVNYFRENGYNVIMDRMVSEEITSQGPTRWGENQIRKARKVLIFLSPGLVNLALDGREDSQCQDINRVWIELEVLRDLYTRNRSAAKMVCIALPDVPVTSEALPLWAKVSYKWPEDALEILKRLNDRPMILPV